MSFKFNSEITTKIDSVRALKNSNESSADNMELLLPQNCQPFFIAAQDCFLQKKEQESCDSEEEDEASCSQNSRVFYELP